MQVCSATLLVFTLRYFTFCSSISVLFCISIKKQNAHPFIPATRIEYNMKKATFFKRTRNASKIFEKISHLEDISGYAAEQFCTNLGDLFLRYASECAKLASDIQNFPVGRTPPDPP